MLLFLDKHMLQRDMGFPLFIFVYNKHKPQSYAQGLHTDTRFEVSNILRNYKFVGKLGFFRLNLEMNIVFVWTAY